MNQLVSLHRISLAECLATELTHEIFDPCMKSTFGTCEKQPKGIWDNSEFCISNIKKIKITDKKRQEPRFTSYFLSKPFHYIQQKINPRETDVGSEILFWEIPT